MFFLLVIINFRFEFKFEMIYTMSVLRGYEASKGFIFLSIAFFIGSCTVSIPGQDELDVYSLKVEDMNVLYGFQLLVHFLTTV